MGDAGEVKFWPHPLPKPKQSESGAPAAIAHAELTHGTVTMRPGDVPHLARRSCGYSLELVAHRYRRCADWRGKHYGAAMSWRRYRSARSAVIIRAQRTAIVGLALALALTVVLLGLALARN
jgi:hypothetical protein